MTAVGDPTPTRHTSAAALAIAAAATAYFREKSVYPVWDKRNHTGYWRLVIGEAGLGGWWASGQLVLACNVALARCYRMLLKTWRHSTSTFGSAEPLPDLSKWARGPMHGPDTSTPQLLNEYLLSISAPPWWCSSLIPAVREGRATSFLPCLSLPPLIRVPHR